MDKSLNTHVLSSHCMSLGDCGGGGGGTTKNCLLLTHFSIYKALDDGKMLFSTISVSHRMRMLHTEN